MDRFGLPLDSRGGDGPFLWIYGWDPGGVPVALRLCTLCQKSNKVGLRWFLVAGWRQSGCLPHSRDAAQCCVGAALPADQ